MVRLRAGESFPVQEESRRRLVLPVQKKATTARASDAGVRKKSKGSGSPGAAMPPMPPSRARPKRAAAAATAAVGDAHVLGCGVCFAPLKPPIFQCKWGHVVCSVCHRKLKASGKCHVCGIATSGNSTCDSMERLVESIRIPCLNAAHGCTTRTTYYDQHCHLKTCLHMPCHCPSEACSFVGSMTVLMDHFEAVHGWLCTTMVRAATTDDDEEDEYYYEFNACLHEGFNFLLADCPTDGILQLFLLNVVRQPHGSSISVLCIHPRNNESKEIEMQCDLRYSKDVHLKSRRGDGKLIKHYQESTFRVECTDLSDGLPSPDECFQFVVPKSVLADSKTIEVGGQIIISFYY